MIVFIGNRPDSNLKKIVQGQNKDQNYRPGDRPDSNLHETFAGQNESQNYRSIETYGNLGENPFQELVGAPSYKCVNAFH